MKPYEKPRLIAMSLSGSNTLCSSCQIDIIGDNADPTFQEIAGDFEFTFGAAEDSCANGFTIEGYCKFTATDGVVINS